VVFKVDKSISFLTKLFLWVVPVKQLFSIYGENYSLLQDLIDYELDAWGKDGVDKVAGGVIITLGYKGSNVLFEKTDGSPRMV